jgi:SAM-dependent methyltransferase
MSSGDDNQYSSLWFAFFHAGIPGERTRRDMDFLVRHLPLPGFQRIADVCCGMGRHSRALSELGYRVTGVDRDAEAIARAREAGREEVYEQADVREWEPAPASFDAVIVMSQSFGHFEAEPNFSVLEQMVHAVRPQGRLVLDLWDPEFFIPRQGERDFAMPIGTVKETKCVRDGRLEVRLDYPSGDCDQFSWQLFTPEEFAAFAAPAGLRPLGSFGGYTVEPPAGAVPAWQCVLERAGP